MLRKREKEEGTYKIKGKTKGWKLQIVLATIVRKCREKRQKRNRAHTRRREVTRVKCALTNRSEGQKFSGLEKNAPKWQRC